MVGHHCPTYMTTLEMVITCTVTFMLECALDVWDPPVKNSWSNHMSQFCYLFLAAREVGEPCKQLCITPKMLSKPRCWCEQLGIQPWWHPQLYHIRKLTESWCQFNFKLLWCYNNLWSNTFNLMQLKSPHRLSGRPGVLGPHYFYHDCTIRVTSLISNLHTIRRDWCS